VYFRRSRLTNWPVGCVQTLLTEDTCQKTDNEGRTVLHIAAEIGSLDAAKVILEIGGKQCLEQRDNLNRTPLILATLNAHGKLLNYLLEQGGRSLVLVVIPN
jgi:ankyrin repeat protein